MANKEAAEGVAAGLAILDVDAPASRFSKDKDAPSILPPDNKANRARIPPAAWIIALRTIGNNNEHVALGTKVYIVARFGKTLDDFGRPVNGDRNIHEEVDISCNVSGSHPMRCEGRHEVVST